ncbi:MULTISPECIES: DUF433 domain-containing protein [unclassified Microcoleus]
MIVAFVASRMRLEELLDKYPGIESEDISACCL